MLELYYLITHTFFLISEISERIKKLFTGKLYAILCADEFYPIFGHSTLTKWPGEKEMVQHVVKPQLNKELQFEVKQ